MSEWSNVPVSKTGEQKCSGGSNPPLCANLQSKDSRANEFCAFRLSAPTKCRKAFFVRGGFSYTCCMFRLSAPNKKSLSNERLLFFIR